MMTESTNTRSQILDIAQDSIQRNGVNSTSYADISKAIGIRKASIHYYFPTKEDLIKELLDRYSQQFFTLVEQIVVSKKPPLGKLNSYCGLFAKTLNTGDRNKACLCGILSAELKTLSEPIVARVIKFYQDNEKYLTQILQEGLKTGEFSFKGSPDAVAKLIFSLMEGDLLVARADGGVARLQETTEQMMALITS
ncbi:MAG: TetR/AcrR family transcriptional regulator [Cyanobacteria bacterium J06600_6]